MDDKTGVQTGSESSSVSICQGVLDGDASPLIMIHINHDVIEVMPGPIKIKRPDVAEDIRTLAHLMGLSITDAIASAVRGQLAIERVKGDANLRKRRKEAEKALAELRSLPIVGHDISDEDLYDEHGLPK